MTASGLRLLTVLLCLPVVTVDAEVQDHLSSACNHFLYMGTLPRGLEEKAFKMICQYYGGKPRFVTAYDPVGRIPVYCAYTFKPSDGFKKADVPWMYEPQLSLLSGSREMEPFPSENVPKPFGEAQAVLDDYCDTVNYERGQLNPDEHQNDPNDKAATYTLTNVVPQARVFNIGPWSQHVHTVRQRLNNYCRGTAYMITGVTTSGQTIRRRNTDRLAIPSYFWSAYCCAEYDRNAPYAERSKFPAFAAHGFNGDESNHVQEVTVQQLQEFLKKLTYVGSHFQIFYENCVTSGDAISAMHLT